LTQGLEYALGAMICYGLADFIYKRAAGAGVQAHQFMMVQAWFFAPTVVLYGVFTRTLMFEASAAWGAAAGFFVYTGLYNFARSLTGGAISINAPIFRLSFALTAALAVLLLHEPLTAFKLAGLAFALIAVWLLLGGADAGATPRTRATQSSLMRVLIATLALGIANFIYKIGVRDGASPATLLVAQAGVFISLATTVAWVVDRSIKPPAAAWPYAASAAILLVLAFLLLLESLSRGEASVLVPIAQMSFVVTALFGIMFLRESFTLRKAAGMLAALGALACLARSWPG
jgi:drug/metabolite transporter (DMT)-like permease